MLLTEEDIVGIAQDLLSHRFGGTQQLPETQRLTGSGSAVVLRARVAASPFLPHRSVVLKYIPDTDDPLDDAALVREVAAYQFTNSLSEDVRPGPMLLAYDIDKRIIVLTDSGDGDTFADLLHRDGPDERIQILRNLGAAIGRMHAGTADKKDAFDTLINRMQRNYPDSADSDVERDEVSGRAIYTGLKALEAVGIDTPGLVQNLAEEAEYRLANGSSLAFTPFDLSPDNIIVAERTHFLDYEWADFRDVSFDLASVVAGFPQYVSPMPISDDEAAVFIEAWVGEVDDVWPNVKNEEALHARIVAALVGWATSSVAALQHGADAIVSARGKDGLQMPAGPGDVLRTGRRDSFADSELLGRRDLFETFESTARFARAIGGTDNEVVAAWASAVAARVAEPRLN